MLCCRTFTNPFLIFCRSHLPGILAPSHPNAPGEVSQIGMLKAGTMTPDEVDERLAELKMLDLVYPELMGCEQ
jgi:hypothetical protein